METHTTESNPVQVLKEKGRLVSLDAFRGYTIAAMIVVNDPGSWENVYPPLLHAEWNGITPTDFIYPFFLFIVGVSIALSYSGQLQKGVPRKAMAGKIWKRAAIIFGLGIFLNLFPAFDFANLRIPGVLQRIALVFLACAFLFLQTDWKVQARLGIALLVLYWLVMMYIPVPGYGVPMLEPGKNLAAWLDGLLIPGKMWQGTWDPEGVLSTVPAVVTGITGMLAGRLLLSGLSKEHKIIWLLVAGFGAFALGNMWDWFFPINKNLWTSSYVLYTSGLATMVLATCYWLVDVQGYQRWTSVGIIFGANAITAYVIAGVLSGPLFLKFGGETGFSIHGAFMALFNGLYLDPKTVSLLWALFYCALCFLPVYWLYRKKVFIKV
jgi:predicted acyltransferase